MALIHFADIPTAEVAPGVRARRALDQSSGAGAITIGELFLDPGAELPLHRHKVEEGIVVLAGSLEFRLGPDSYQAGPGDVLHAPAGVAHGLHNRGTDEVHIAFSFPSVNVEREWV